MRWVSEIFAEPDKPRTSLSRFWTNIVMAVATWVIINMEITGRTSWEIIGTYVGLVLGYEATKRGVSTHYSTSVEREKIRASRVDSPD